MRDAKYNIAIFAMTAILLATQLSFSNEFSEERDEASGWEFRMFKNRLFDNPQDRRGESDYNFYQPYNLNMVRDAQWLVALSLRVQTSKSANDDSKVTITRLFLNDKVENTTFDGIYSRDNEVIILISDADTGSDGGIKKRVYRIWYENIFTTDLKAGRDALTDTYGILRFEEVREELKKREFRSVHSDIVAVKNHLSEFISEHLHEILADREADPEESPDSEQGSP